MFNDETRKYKILQIMPAPANSYLRGNSEKYGTEKLPIICLALVEDMGMTYIQPYVGYNDGGIEALDGVTDVAKGEEVFWNEHK